VETAFLVVSRNPLLGATALLIALTIILTWPQFLFLGSKVADHGDPFLSIWRISWIAHVLPGDFRHLFDGNIFHPHLRTLAYSDATLLEGLIALPWLWARTNPVLIYNLLLLTGIVSSGVGMFVLVRHLTGNVDAALVSAVVFTLAPYRILHFMHLELQWTMWMPLTLWAVHRAFETGSLRAGAAIGALLCLQVLSCLYYGAFLGLMVGALVILLAIWQPRRLTLAAIPPLGTAAALALLVTAAYAQPYIANAQVLGVRDPGEVANFSAQLVSYVTAPQENWLWGWTAFRFQGDELRLCPGFVPVALAVMALAHRRRRPLTWIYVVLVAMAVELSLGLNGTVYPWLHAHIWMMKGFRAPARFAILACCALAVLAGFGFEYLTALFQASRLRRWLLVAVLVAIGLECGSAPMRLTEVPKQVPDVYKYLRAIDRSVIIELPIVDWDLSSTYMFWSTKHWHQLVNGYSGYAPPDYVETLTRMDTFPDDDAFERLREMKVHYILVHESFYLPKERAALLVKLARRRDVIPIGRYKDWIGPTQVFELKPD
jgi:hypothetical protein